MSVAHGSHMRRWLFSLPPVEYLMHRLRATLIGSLKCGPIPEHVAFVMDGNRRYARKNKVETVEGHHMGFEALARVLEVCYKSGVRVVTIYAFSIENFKRSKYEVDGLMDMAKTKLVQMSQHGELLDRYGASVRILGDRSLMREDVLQQVDLAVEMTKHNSSAVLNVCFPYTGREEITHSIRETVRDFSSPPLRSQSQRPFSETHIQRNILSSRQNLPSVAEEDRPSEPDTPSTPPSQSRPQSQPIDNNNNDITTSTASSDAESAEFSEQDLESSSIMLHPASSHTSHTSSPMLKPSSTSHSRSPRRKQVPQQPLPDVETITAATITKNTYTSDAPPLDLLIRTSGVQRLSDFMLWQCHETTEIRFLDCLWPEFDLWHFLPILLEWQWKQFRSGSGQGEEGRSRALSR